MIDTSAEFLHAGRVPPQKKTGSEFGACWRLCCEIVEGSVLHVVLVPGTGNVGGIWGEDVDFDAAILGSRVRVLVIGDRLELTRAGGSQAALIDAELLQLQQDRIRSVG